MFFAAGLRLPMSGQYNNYNKDTSIPLNARIFAITDVFDALTSERPYKKALSLTATMEIMQAGNGSHFDSHLLATIAGELHAEVNRSDEKTLEIALDAIVDRYFKSS